MLGPGPFVSAQFNFKVQSNCGRSSETAFAPRMPQCVSPRRRPQKVKPPNRLLWGEGRGLSRKPTYSPSQLPSNWASRARAPSPRPPAARAESCGRHVLRAARANAAAPGPTRRQRAPPRPPAAIGGGSLPLSMPCAWRGTPSQPQDTSRAFCSLSETQNRHTLI